MKERGNIELASLLRRHGLIAEKRVDAYWKQQRQGVATPVHPGRPDYLFTRVRDGYRQCAEIEFKAVDGTGPLAFVAIEPQQRLWLTSGPEWLTDAERATWPADSWLALTMGSQPHYRDNPRRFWIVPWLYWLTEVEPRLLDLGLQSLPYSATTSGRVAVREAGLGACELLAPFVLEWRYKAWWIPDTHAFAGRYGAFLIREQVKMPSP